MTPVDAFFLERVILGLGVAATSVEDIFHSRRLFGSGAVLEARNVELLSRKTTILDKAILRVLDSARSVNVFLSMRAAIGLTMCLPLIQPVITAVLLAALICQLILVRRLRVGLDGSDQMTTVVAAGLATAALVPSSLLLTQAFIALQLTIAYATAGLAKLSSRTWRSGQGFRGVMSTALYGNPHVSRVLSAHSALPVLVSMGVYGGQIALAILFLVGGTPAVLAVAMAAFFHVLVAITMRLTAFVFAFGAGLPAVLLLSDYSTRADVWRSLLHELHP